MAPSSLTYTISVIIPNYNRASIIGDTIENMLRQSLSPSEIIVIDDGSTDNSIEVLKGFGDRITLIKQSNQGPGAARNAGLKIATGEFIQFMDSDDLASLNKLEHQAKKLDENNADIVYGSWLRTFINGHHLKSQNVILQQNSIPKHKHMISSFLTGWSLVFQSCLFRTSFIEKVGLYRTDLWTCDDSEFFFRMLLQSPKIIHENKTLTLYRLDDYGKVTASGFQNIKRIEDWAKFQTTVIESCANSQELQSLTKHLFFLVDVWRTYELLKRYNSQDIGVVQKLEVFLEKFYYHKFLSMISRIFEIKAGLQERIIGHRWNSDYQLHEISSDQKRVIMELGFDWTLLD